MQKPIYLVDGSGYIFRAFYAIPNLATKSGFPTNALFGFMKMLAKLIGGVGSHHVVVVFDAGRDTFRKELYPAYKANRNDPPQELVQQFPFFRPLASALGLPVVDCPGYEADDVIATLSKKLSSQGQPVVVVTADKDLMQMVSETVTLWDTMRDKKVGRAEVIEKFGVPPERVTDALALIGDTSDNIPGAKGLGPKTAAQILEMYSSIDDILAATADIRENSKIRNRQKIADVLEQDADLIRLSKVLATVKNDVPLNLLLNGERRNIEDLNCDELINACRRRKPHTEELLELADKFEFTSFLRDLGHLNHIDKEANKFKFTTIYAENFTDWLQSFKVQTCFSIDTETDSLDTLSANLVGVSIAWSDSEAFYIPLRHTTSPHAQVSIERFLMECKESLENPKVGKIGQNLKFDLQVFKRLGVELRGIVFDTMVAAYLLHPDRRGYGLDQLAKELLGYTTIPYKQVTEGADNFSQVPVEKATEYAAEDAIIAYQLEQQLHPRIVENSLQALFNDIEMPLVSILGQMEANGILLDTDYFRDLSLEFETRLLELERRAEEYAGERFNLNSPKQLAAILFEKLDLPTKGLKKTKTGISTDSGVLETLSHSHPLPGVLLEYRTLSKLKSTFVDALLDQISPVTGRLHTKFLQVATGTGRLSSSEPNLQNIPVQGAEGGRIRAGFIAPKDSVLISADYSQIELRVLAHMSGDENLSEAFLRGEDIHERTARLILSKGSDEEVTPDERRIGKTINFGVVYGMSGFRLARELGFSPADGQRFINEYFAQFPKVKVLFEKLELEGKEKGEVRTLYGRRRILREIDASTRDPGFLARVATNAPLQGTAADLVKIAMIKVSRILEQQMPTVKLLLQIHDELLFECPESLAEEAKDLIQQAMEGVVSDGAMPWGFPLKVDIGVGRNWTEAQD